MKTTKVMLDTNILISAIYSSSSPTYAAFRKASEHPYSLVLCDQILDELRRIFNRKFPEKITAMERFLAVAHYDMVTLSSEDLVQDSESQVRDIHDRPILRAALKVGVEILVTGGDKDFLESCVSHPQIMTAVTFLSVHQ